MITAAIQSSASGNIKLDMNFLVSVIIIIVLVYVVLKIGSIVVRIVSGLAAILLVFYALSRFGIHINGLDGLWGYLDDMLNLFTKNFSSLLSKLK